LRFHLAGGGQKGETVMISDRKSGFGTPNKSQVLDIKMDAAFHGIL
jgi:hypothetical protein